MTAQEPNSEAAGEPTPGAEQPSRRRSLLTRKRLLMAAGLIALVIALVIGWNRLGDVPQERADEYAAAAAPAAADLHASMNRTYLSLDAYIRESLIPRSEIRNADDPDELKRRILPAIDASRDELKEARKRIANSKRQIREQRAALTDAPDTVPLVDNAPAEEAERMTVRARALLGSYERHLKSYGRFVDYALAARALDREQTIVVLDDDAVPADGSIDEVKSGLEGLKNRVGSLRRDYLKLDPPPDAKSQHETTLEMLTVSVDYYDDLLAGLAALDVAALDQAYDEFLSSARGLSKRANEQFRRFTAGSSVQRSSRKLTERANAFERDLNELNSEDPAKPKRWERPTAPAPAPPGGGKSPNGGGQLS